MEIRTNRSRDVKEPGVVPPPDRGRHPKKKIAQKTGRSPIAGHRFVSALKTLGKVAVCLLMIALTLSIFIFAGTSQKFNLRTVTFHGCSQLNPEQLEKIIRRDFPANVLRIDLRRLQERLQQETWVQQVEIRRILPADLIIYVRERTPSVILEMNGELMVTDRAGTLLDRYQPAYGKLDVPVFKGALGEDPESYRMYQDENAARILQGMLMLSEIESGCPDYARSISEVDISEKDNLKILLVDDTAEIYLGEKDYRRRFCTLMSNLGQYRELKNQYRDIPSVDMRFDGQIVYRLGRADGKYSEKTGN